MAEAAQVPVEVSTSVGAKVLGIVSAAMVAFGGTYLTAKVLTEQVISKNEMIVFGGEVVVGAVLGIVAIIWDAVTRRRVG